VYKPHSLNRLTRKGGNTRSPIKYRGGNNSEVVHYYLLPIIWVPEGNYIRLRSIVYKCPIETNILTTWDLAETLYSI
jgi:hypothetical protein